MDDIIRIAGIVEESIVDGPGIRFVIFTQGCPHKCLGCHNAHTHSDSGGYDIFIEDIVMQVRKNPLLDGVTLSGGEPFCQAKNLFKLVTRLKMFNYNILVYSGYTVEELLEKSKEDKNIKNLLYSVDTLIDGPFRQDLVDYSLKFRGSSNQRIINIKDLKAKYKD